MNASADTDLRFIGTHQTFRGAEYAIRFWCARAPDMLNASVKEDAVTLLAMINRNLADNMIGFPVFIRDEVRTIAAASLGLATKDFDMHLDHTGALLTHILEPDPDMSILEIKIENILNFMQSVQHSMLQRLLDT